MRRDRPYLWLLAATVLAVATVLLSGCDAAAPTDTTLVVGDSNTMQALFEGGFPADWDIHSMLGWEAEDAQPGATDRATDPERSPCAAAMALGHNDAAVQPVPPPEGDGWTTTDAAQMRQLRATFHPDTLVMWVLPDYDGPSAEYAANVELYRVWATTEAARHGDTVADWRPAKRPEYDSGDGIHHTPAGRLAYGRFITERMPICG